VLFDITSDVPLRLWLGLGCFEKDEPCDLTSLLLSVTLAHQKKFQPDVTPWSYLAALASDFCAPRTPLAIPRPTTGQACSTNGDNDTQRPTDTTSYQYRPSVSDNFVTVHLVGPRPMRCCETDEKKYRMTRNLRHYHFLINYFPFAPRPGAIPCASRPSKQ
jgi:hypothetical protein